MKKNFYAEYFRVEDRHWWFIGRRRIFLSILDRYLGVAQSPRRRVLDIGCGTGTMLDYLGRYGEVTGVDSDEQAIGFCRARGVENVRLLETDHLPFDDASFDLVTAFDVLEHIADDEGMLEEVKRVLRPGGTFLAAVPAHPGLWGAQDEVSQHERRYRRRELKTRIAGSGMQLERLSYFNAILAPPIAAIRLFRRLRPPRGELQSDFEMNGEGGLNSFLAELFGTEARWLRHANLPFGISLLALARKAST